MIRTFDLYKFTENVDVKTCKMLCASNGGKNCAGAMSKVTGDKTGDCYLGMQPGKKPNGGSDYKNTEN